MKKVIILLTILAVIFLVGAGLVFLSSRWQTYNQPETLNLPENTNPANNASSTSNISSSTPTVDTSSWKKFSSDEIGYEIQYPSDLIVNGHGTTLILAFPQKNYFHWPLLDDSKITISAQAKCPKITVASAMTGGSATTTVTINGQTFNRYVGEDVAAGNAYHEVIYQTEASGMCYQLELYEHGANGAGLYVNDADLITRYDNQHEIDQVYLKSVMEAMVQSFKIRLVPAGIPEQNANQAQ